MLLTGTDSPCNRQVGIQSASLQIQSDRLTSLELLWSTTRITPVIIIYGDYYRVVTKGSIHYSETRGVLAVRTLSTPSPHHPVTPFPVSLPQSRERRCNTADYIRPSSIHLLSRQVYGYRIVEQLETDLISLYMT